MIRTFVITDANGCTTIATTVSPITDPTVTATVMQVVTGSDGSVTLTELADQAAILQ
jgi:hypothetical protein